MTKAILFDVDGVVLFPRDKYFSQRLKEEGYELDEQRISQFFKNQYKQIVIGKADLKEEVSEEFRNWGWSGTVDELLDFWFSYENKLNQEVIDFAQELRQKQIKCFLSSDHSKYREQDLLHNVGLVEYFDGEFFSASLGYTKEEKEYYQQILSSLNLTPEEIVFIDDDIGNIEIASQVLPNVIHFTSFEKLKGDLHV